MQVIKTIALQAANNTGQRILSSLSVPAAQDSGSDISGYITRSAHS